VECKFVFPLLCYMCCHYSSHCCRNANGSEFSFVVRIFVETEEVGVGEEVTCGRWYMDLVNHVEEIL